MPDLDLWPAEEHHPFGQEDYCPSCFGLTQTCYLAGGPRCTEPECMCPCSDERLTP